MKIISRISSLLDHQLGLKAKAKAQRFAEIALPTLKTERLHEDPIRRSLMKSPKLPESSFLSSIIEFLSKMRVSREVAWILHEQTRIENPVLSINHE